MADVVASDPVGRGGPRVTFTMFASDEDPMLRAWLRFRDPLVGSRDPDARPSVRHVAADLHRPKGDGGRGGGRVGSREVGFWRMLASNNRELGRSYLLYRSFEQARAHVHALQGQSDALDVTYVSGPVTGSRGWVLTAAGEPVMTCSRWYESTSARAAAAVGALAAFPRAVVSDAPDRSGRSGRYPRAAERALRS